MTGGYSDREQAQLDRWVEEDNGRSLDDARRKERVVSAAAGMIGADPYHDGYACECTTLARCPLHEAAPEMLVALRALVGLIEVFSDAEEGMDSGLDEARAIISRLAGDGDV